MLGAELTNALALQLGCTPHDAVLQAFDVVRKIERLVAHLVGVRYKERNRRRRAELAGQHAPADPVAGGCCTAYVHLAWVLQFEQHFVVEQHRALTTQEPCVVASSATLGHDILLTLEDYNLFNIVN